MKILITSHGSNFLDGFDFRFGRCEYLIIYDTELNIFNSIKNEAKALEVGAGEEVAKKVKDLKVDLVLTGRLGPKARKIIRKLNIEVQFVEGETVAEVVKDYQSTLKKVSSACY